MNKSNWFEADAAGLRQLMSGKPKWFALREILQNCFDETITECRVSMLHEKGIAHIDVEDNSLIGFRDITDAFTLYKECYKRGDATKRGRFNEGEKLAFSICESAIVETTKGTVTFSKRGRCYNTNRRREQGTIVRLNIRMTKQEFADILTYVGDLIVPEGIRLYLNGQEIRHKTPSHEFIAKLQTEILKGSAMTKTVRETAVQLYERQDAAFLYEMGIPVCRIECAYSINVTQRVPLGRDRDCVNPSYLQDLYAETLNATCDEITPEQSSDLWVRTAMRDDRVDKKAVQTVIKQRYGDKVVVASPNDPIANDDALSNGYRVVYGSELSGDEWEQIRDAGAITSSHEVFGKTGTAGETVEPNEDMEWVAALAKKIAKEIMHIDLMVEFRKPVKGQWNANAYYDRDTKKITFNTGGLGKKWFSEDNMEAQLNLIIHEIGHEDGGHCEASYHEALTRIGSRLVMIALRVPDFFKRATEIKKMLDSAYPEMGDERTLLFG